MIKPVSIGHLKQKERLLALLKKDLIPHSIVFSGPAGVGKSLIARELGASLLCAERNKFGSCSNCPECKLIEAGNHPDLYFVNCDNKESAGVEAIRSLLYSLNLKPFRGGKRVVIFEQAEYLDERVANILLKTFEEPRQDTYFILVTANRSRLPATLLSRCQTWHFDYLSETDFKVILRKLLDAAPEDSPLKLIPENQLTLLGAGSFQGLASIAEEHELFLRLEGLINDISLGNVGISYALASELGADKDTLRSKLSLLRVIARRNMQQSTTTQEQRKFARFLDDVLTAEYALFQRNLAPLTVMAVAFLNLAGVGSDPVFGDETQALLKESII